MAYRVLLADDSITIQKVVELILSDEDVEIESVGDGIEALDSLSRRQADVVLADIEMPRMNGYELCERIKADPETRSTPVILLAGAFEAFDESHCRRVGADDYLIKPFDSTDLIGKINAFRHPTAIHLPGAAEAGMAEFAETVEAEAVSITEGVADEEFVATAELVEDMGGAIEAEAIPLAEAAEIYPTAGPASSIDVEVPSETVAAEPAFAPEEEVLSMGEEMETASAPEPSILPIAPPPSQDADLTAGVDEDFEDEEGWDEEVEFSATGESVRRAPAAPIRPPISEPVPEPVSVAPVMPEPEPVIETPVETIPDLAPEPAPAFTAPEETITFQPVVEEPIASAEELISPFPETEEPMPVEEPQVSAPLMAAVEQFLAEPIVAMAAAPAAAPVPPSLPAMSREEVLAELAKTMAGLVPTREETTSLLRARIDAIMPDRNEVRQMVDAAVRNSVSGLIDAEGIRTAISGQMTGFAPAVQSAVSEYAGKELAPAFKTALESVLWEVIPEATVRILRETVAGAVQSALGEKMQELSSSIVSGTADTLASRIIDRLRTGS